MMILVVTTVTLIAETGSAKAAAEAASAGRDAEGPYTRLYDTLRYFAILCYTILYDTIRYYVMRYYTILCYTILYDNMLYYNLGMP